MAGLSPEEVAKRAGLVPTRIEELEQRGTDATVGELYALARVLRLDIDALLREEIQRQVGATLAFRSRDAEWAALSDADLRACEAALHAGRSLLEANERLGRPRARRWALEAAAPGAQVESEVRVQARAVRELLGNAEGRLPDLLGVYETLDVIVTAHAFEAPDIEAVAVIEAGGTASAAVLVAPSAHAWRNELRRRVLLAHELCHVLFDRASEGTEAIVDFDAESLSEADGAEPKRSRYLPQALPRERRARAFAAELLMPTAALHTLLGPPRGVHDFTDCARMVDAVRDHFETPLEIALNQLWNRRYLSPPHGFGAEDGRLNLLNYLRWRLGGATGTRPGNAPPLDLLSRRVQEAWYAGRCSDGEARRWLGLSPFDALPFAPLE